MSPAKPSKALGIVRLSHRDDESTSPARQRLKIEEKAEALGIPELDIVEDLATSAFRIHPLERPKLAVKLKDDEYLRTLTHIIYFRQDRFVRRLLPDFVDMVMLASRHGLKLISATEDLGDPTEHAEMLGPLIKAWLGEGESRSTSARLRDMHEYLRNEGRWGGGQAPYGYMHVPRPDGLKGQILVIDPVAAKIYHDIIRRVIKGESVFSIVADLNARGVLSPHNRRRQLAGLPLKTKAGTDTSGSIWRSSTVETMLRNPNVLGYVIHKRQVVYGPDGTPLVRAKALITVRQWDQLQEALRARQRPDSSFRTQTASLLLRIAYCASCGAPMYHAKIVKPSGRAYLYYRCRDAARWGEARRPCNAPQIRADWLEDKAAEEFLDAVGRVTITRRVYSAGSGTAERLEVVHRALTAARVEHDSGGYSYPGGEEEYRQRVTRLAAEMSALTAEEVVPAGYREEDTGQTFRARWEELEALGDVQAQRQLMLSSGFVLWAIRTPDGPRMVAERDPELAERARRTASGQDVGPQHETDMAAVRAVLGVLTAEGTETTVTQLAGRRRRRR